MKKPRLGLVLILIASLLVAPVAALASDISGATYSGRITITNNSTAATNVATVMTLSSAEMISQGWIDSNFSNVAIRSTAGADIAFMPSINSTVPWSLWVSSIGANAFLDYILYTGGSDMTSTKYYFPGAAGMTVPDDATLELGDNFTASISGYFDATQADDLFYKENAYQVRGDGSGNITVEIGGTDRISQMASNGQGALGASFGLRDGERFNSFPATTIESVTLTLQKILSPTGTASLIIRRQSDSAVIGTLDTIDVSTISTSQTQYTFDANPVENPTVQDIYIAIEYNGGDGTNYVLANIQTTNVYAGGVRSYYSGGTWNDQAGQDQTFDIRLDPIPTATATTTATGVSSGEHTITASTDNQTAVLFGLGIDKTPTDYFPITDGLVLNLPLHHTDMTGASLTSKDSNNYTATVTEATWGAGGRTFDPTNDLITIANFTTTGEATVELWLNVTAGYGVFSRFFKTSGEELAIWAEGSKFNFVIEYGGGIQKKVISTTNIPTGVWVYVVGTYDGSNLYLYENAVQKATAAQVGSIDTVTNSAFINSGGGTTHWAGIMGEVRGYNRALSPTEITAQYNATKWRYDGTVTDASYSDAYFQYVVGASVPDTASDWTIASAVMPYMEYAEITVDGAQAGYWDWEYATVFSDDSGNGNTATPSFRTASSDADVSANLTSFAPISTAIAPAYSVSNAPTFITGNITASSTFTSGNVTGAGIPGSAVIDAAGDASDTPNIWIWGIIAGFTIALGGLLISYMVRQSGGGPGELILRIIWGALVIGLLITFGKFDGWMLFMYLIIVFAPTIASRHQEIGASVSELNFIGFLAMVWVGLTLINRMVEGYLITAAETAHLNNYMFTQEFTLLSVFKMPIINFAFFTNGIPSLLKWDYGFFGGNAQIIQYLLYSLSAVMALIVFGYMASLLTSYFTRLR